MRNHPIPIRREWKNLCYCFNFRLFSHLCNNDMALIILRLTLAKSKCSTIPCSRHVMLTFSYSIYRQIHLLFILFYFFETKVVTNCMNHHNRFTSCCLESMLIMPPAHDAAREHQLSTSERLIFESCNS